MSRISQTFRSLRTAQSGAYIPYVCAGDPDIDFTIELVRRLCRSGADILEIGLPFSDPLADGPTVQEAMGRSLSSGFRVSDVFELVRAFRNDGIHQPIVLMTYYNPVLSFGVGEFCTRLADSGGDAMLVVDLPIEESEELDTAARKNDLDVIRLVTPTTDDGRLDVLLSMASGFAYAVSVAGITGARAMLAESAIALVKRVRSRSELPVVIGFGISSPDHVRKTMAAGASGVVEGSALISRYAPHLSDRSKALELVEQHAREMKAATCRSGPEDLPCANRTL